jgi:type I restriction enzyme S subunit
MEVRSGHKSTEVGVIPHEWEVKSLGDLFEFSGGFTASREQLSDKGHCYLHYGDIHKSGKPFIDVQTEFLDIPKLDIPLNHVSPKSILGDGDVVFVDASEDDVGTSKHVVIINHLAIPYISGLHTIVAKSKDGSLDDRFKQFCFQTADIRRQFYFYAVGTKVSGISKTNIKRVLLPIPPLSEQSAIAMALGDVEALINALNRLITKKRDLKKAVMQQLLSGQIRLPGFAGEWTLKRFGEFALPRKDRVDPRKTRAHPFCVELEHIEPRSGRLTRSIVADTRLSTKSLFKSDDILFGRLRAYLRKYWLADRDGICSTEIWALVANRGLVIPQFLFQMVKTDQFIDAASTTYGTHMPRSDWNVVKNYETRLPSLTEQAAIAAVLSDMDAEIEALEQRLAKTRDLKQGMMQELLTGKTRLI